MRGSASSSTLVTLWSALSSATGGERQIRESIISKSIPLHSRGVPGSALFHPWGQLTCVPTTSASSAVQGKAQVPKGVGRALWLLWPQGQLSQLLEIPRSDVGEGNSSAPMVSYALTFGADSLVPPRASSTVLPRPSARPSLSLSSATADTEGLAQSFTIPGYPNGSWQLPRLEMPPVLYGNISHGHQHLPLHSHGPKHGL